MGYSFRLPANNILLCTIPQAGYHGLCITEFAFIIIYFSTGVGRWQQLGEPDINIRSCLIILNSMEGRYCLTSHSTHFSYGYMASDTAIMSEETRFCHILGYSFLLGARRLL